MKRYISFFLLAILVSACALEIPLLLSATPLPTPAPPTQTVTPSRAPTVTPTQPTPTFTPTPTLIRPEATFTPPFTPSATASPSAEATQSIFLMQPPDSGFLGLYLSGDQLFWGGCQPSEVQISIQAANPGATAHVTLFTRLESKATGADNGWDSGTLMPKTAVGTFSLLLKAEEVRGHDNFNLAWVNFQIVATDARSRTIGKTPVYTRELSLARCP